MDEPTSTIEQLATAKIEELVKVFKQHYTIVIMTHTMQQAAGIFDFTAFFYQGYIIEFGFGFYRGKYGWELVSRKMSHFVTFWIGNVGEMVGQGKTKIDISGTLEGRGGDREGKERIFAVAQKKLLRLKVVKVGKGLHRQLKSLFLKVSQEELFVAYQSVLEKG